MDSYFYDADNQGYPYIKAIHDGCRKRHQNLVGENPKISCLPTRYIRIKGYHGGVDAIRPEEIDAEQFIAQKSFKAKGKRLTTWNMKYRGTGTNPIPEPPSEDNDEEPDGSDLENEG